MRLLECHIEGFGKLVGKSYSFNEGINSFCFENGYGKTTLSAFIKAMLYGLESVKSNSKNFEDRLHYCPFSGAKFGGSLTVSEGNAEYRIERFFDKKSRVKDTLRVYKNKKETDELGEEVGYALLGLDRESFERTLFANSRDEFFGSTDGINAKLNNFSSGEESSALALAALEKAKRTIKAAKGSNDLLTKSEHERLELLSQISNLQSLSDELGTLYRKRETLTKEIAALEAVQKEKTDRKIRAAVIESYHRFTNEMRSRAEACRSIQAEYSTELPSLDTITDLRALSAEARAKEEALAAASNKSMAEKRLAELDEIFNGYPPSDEEISKIETFARESERISEQISAKRGAAENFSREKRTLPSSAELSEKKARLTEYNGIRAEIENLVSASQAEKKTVKIPLLISGIVLAAASIPFIFLLLPMFFVLLFAGAIISFAGAIISFLSIGRGSSSGSAAVRLAQLRAKSEAASEEIKLFLAKYGFFTEGGIVFNFSQLEGACLSQAENEMNAVNQSAEISLLTERRESLKLAISEFFSRFGYSADEPYKASSEIRGLARERATLSAQMKQGDERVCLIRRELDGIYGKRLSILESLGIDEKVLTDAMLERMAKDRQALDFELSELERVKRQREEFKSKNRITEEEISAGSSTEGVEFSADELFLKRHELAATDRDIAETEDKAQLLPEKQNALELSEEKIERLKKRLAIITKTQDFIIKAEENLLEKFVGPVMAKFKSNLSELSDTTGEKFSMDLNFNLKFEDGGEMRSEMHLSSGQRAIVDLALRLALADALFGNGKQFVFLDDPFVNLDELYMEKVRAYLEKASKTRQIVYFCCHNSRKI